MEGIAGIDPRGIEQRKERIRRAWSYRRVDHLPLCFVLEDLSRYTLRELCESGQRQFEMNVRNIDRLLRLLPDDYLPTARLWPGYLTIATMFGLEVHWSDNPNQPPGVLRHVIFDVEQLDRLPRPDPAHSGLMPFILSWTRYFAQNFPPEVSITGPDLGGPMNTAKDLFDTNLLFTAFYDHPEDLRSFLDLAAEVQIGCYREVLKAAVDINRLTCIDFDPMWAPEGRKGFVSDDVCAGFSARFFEEFSRPYNNRIFRLWPGGRLHNCGPHPAVFQYLHHDPPINGLNCSYRYTRNELSRIREAFRGRGIVEFMFDNGESPEQMIRGYEEIAAALAPEVVAMPIVWLNETWKDDDIRGVYEGLRTVAEGYAGAMRWRESGEGI